MTTLTLIHIQTHATPTKSCRNQKNKQKKPKILKMSTKDSTLANSTSLAKKP